MGGLSGVPKFPTTKVTSFFSGKKTTEASSTNPSDPGKHSKGTAGKEPAAESSSQRLPKHTPGQQAPLSLQGQDHWASTRKTRGNPSQEQPATPPSDKNAKSPSKGGGRLGRFFQRLLGKNGKTTSGEEGTAAGTSPKTGSTGPKPPPLAKADDSPLVHPKPGETPESFAARVPSEQQYFAQIFPSKERPDKNRAALSRDPGPAAAAPRRSGSAGPKAPSPARMDTSPLVHPRTGESPESFFVRAPEEQRGFAQIYNPKGHRGNAGKPSSTRPGKSAATPGVNKEQRDLLFQRFDALKEMGPPASRRSPPKN